MQPGQTRKAIRIDALYDLGKFRRALRGYKSLHRKFPSEARFVARVLHCLEQLGTDVRSFLSGEFSPNSRWSPAFEIQVATAFAGIARWLNERPTDADLSLRQDLCELAQTSNAKQNSDSSLCDEAANAELAGAIAEFAMAIVQTFEADRQQELETAISWFCDDPFLAKATPENVLTDRLIRLLGQVFALRKTAPNATPDHLNEFVRNLPVSPAFQDWPWVVFLALLRGNLNPIDFDRVPDVTTLPCSTNARYGRLWSVLWEAGDQDRLLEQYADHVAMHCDEAAADASAARDRVLARSGDLSRLPTDIDLSKTKIAVQEICDRISSSERCDFGLLSSASEYVQKLSKQNPGVGPVRRLANLIIDTAIENEQPAETMEVALFLSDEAPLRAVPARTIRSRLNKWLKRSLKNFPSGQLNDFVSKIPPSLPEYDEWRWFVFEQCRELNVNLLEHGLLPDAGATPCVKPLQYAQLFQYIKQRQSDAELTEIIERVIENCDDTQVRLVCWRYIAGCGRIDLLPRDLKNPQATEDWLKELIDWVLLSTLDEQNDRELLLLRFLQLLDELDTQSSRVAGLLKYFISNKLQWVPHAESRGEIFNDSIAINAVGESYIQTMFVRWVATWVLLPESDAMFRLRDSLPDSLREVPEAVWRFFELVDQQGLDATDRAAIPNVLELPQATPGQYRLLWNHLERHGHHSLGAEWSRLIAERFGDRESLVNSLQAQLRGDDLPTIVAMEAWFAQPAALQLTPHLRDILARDVLDRFCRESIPPQDALSWFSQLDFLPLGNTTLLAIEFRKAVGNFDWIAAEDDPSVLLNAIPEKIQFDRTWPLHRLVVLKRRELTITEDQIVAATPSAADLSTAELIVACRSLEELNANHVLCRFSATGLQIVCDVRLYLMHCIGCVRTSNFESLSESTEYGLLLAEISGRPEPRLIGQVVSAVAVGQVSADVSDQHIDSKELMNRLRARLSNDSFDLKMLEQLLLIIAGGEPEVAVGLISRVLERSRQQEDPWIRYQRVLFDFLRMQCHPDMRVRVLASVDEQLLPIDWITLLAQTLLNFGQFTEADRYCRQALEIDNDYTDALLIEARVNISEFRLSEALSICDRVLARQPDNVRAQLLRMNAMRLCGAANADLVERIDQWSQSVPAARRRRYHVSRLLDILLPEAAFHECWQWFNEDRNNQESRTFLGRSLFALGEFGTAGSFLKDSTQLKDEPYADIFADQNALRDVETLRTLLDQPSIEFCEALEICRTIAESDQSEDDSIPPVTQRLKVPECLMSTAVAWSTKRTTSGTVHGPIAIVTASLGPGGAERQIVYTATGLVRRLHRPEKLIVICSNLNEQHNRAFFVEELKSESVRVELAESFFGTDLNTVINEELPAKRLLDCWPDSRGGRSIRNYYATFTKLKPRVVYASQDETNILAGFAALLAGVSRIVLSGRSLNPSYFSEQSEWLRTAYRILMDSNRMDNTNVVLVNNSQAGMEDYRQWIGPSSLQPTLSNNNINATNVDVRTDVIHNGFDFAAIDIRLQSRSAADVRRQLGIPADALLFGCVLRMHKIKRPQVCLEVIVGLLKRFPNAHGIMIGDGPLTESILQFAEQTGLMSKLHFLRSVKPVEPYMAAMDLLLLASEIEGLPNVLVESQAAGTPVTSTDAGGARETFLPGESGLLLESGPPDALAEQIANWVGTDHFQRASAAGRKFVVEQFNLPRMLDQTIAVLGIEDMVSDEPGLKLPAPPDGEDSSIRPVLAKLWKQQKFRELAELTHSLANRNASFHLRFMQLRALTMLDEFERATEVIFLPEIINAAPRELKRLQASLLLNAMRSMAEAPERGFRTFHLLGQLPAVGHARLRGRLRGAIRQLTASVMGGDKPCPELKNDPHRFARLFDLLPVRPIFDPALPYFRIRMLERVGISPDQEQLAALVKDLDTCAVSVDEILMFQTLLVRCNFPSLAEKLAEIGSGICSNPRLLKTYCEDLLSQNAPSAPEVAERFFRASLVMGDLGLIPIRTLANSFVPKIRSDESVDLSNEQCRQAREKLVQCLASINVDRPLQPLGCACQIIIELHRLDSGADCSADSDARDKSEHLQNAVKLLNSDSGIVLQQEQASQLMAILRLCVAENALEDLFAAHVMAHSMRVQTPWIVEIAAHTLKNGHLNDAMSTIELGLKQAPTDQQLLLRKAHGLVLQNKTGSAEQICLAIVEENPRNLEAWRAYLTVLRSRKVSEARLVDFIQQAASNWPDKQRCDIRGNMYLVAALPHRAFVDAWNWFQEKPESKAANSLLGKALMTLGEMGVAEYFFERADNLKDDSSDSATDLTSSRIERAFNTEVDYIQQLRDFLNAEPLNESKVTMRCRRLLSEIENGKRYLRQYNDPQDTQWADESSRTPECFFRHIRELAGNPSEGFTGPACIVTSSLGPGGAERQVVYTAIGLTKELGSENVSVLCGNLGEHRNTSFFLPQLSNAGVRVFNANEAASSESDMQVELNKRIETLLKLWPENQGRRYITNYYRFFRQHKPRVIQAWQDETSVLAGIAAVLAGVPRIVLGGRSLSPAHRPTKPTYLHAAWRFLHEFTQVSITNNSAAGARDYCQWLDIEKDAIDVIHNGIDFDQIKERLRTATPDDVRQQLNIPKDALLFGAVSRMNEVKRPDLCLDIMLELLSAVPGSYAVLVGDGSMWQEVSARGLSSQHAERLRFPGAIHPVEPWMAAMDLLLLTSRVEGLPNVLIEAQAVGTAVASMDVGGAAETFVPGESGLLLHGRLLEGDGPKACADQIAEFVMQPGALKQAGEIGRNYVTTEFSTRRMLQRTREILGLDASDAGASS